MNMVTRNGETKKIRDYMVEIRFYHSDEPDRDFVDDQKSGYRTLATALQGGQTAIVERIERNAAVYEGFLDIVKVNIFECYTDETSWCCLSQVTEF